MAPACGATSSNAWSRYGGRSGVFDQRGYEEHLLFLLMERAAQVVVPVKLVSQDIHRAAVTAGESCIDGVNDF